MDVAVLGADGSPARQVSLRMECHEVVQHAAEQHQCVQLIRMHDYYDEVTYGTSDLPTLLKELRLITGDLSPAWEALLLQLQRLVEHAISGTKELHVLPD